MKWLMSFAVIYFCTNQVIGQKQATNWYFGNYVGLNFSSGRLATPSVNSGMSTMEGTATISDSETGQLLFYSDAVKVWNRENKPMPNSGDDDPREGINRHYSALSQGALIVPAPSDPHIFYLFSLIESDPAVTEQKPPGVLTYSRIDMRLDNGKGDVILSDKSTLVTGGLVGRLTAIPHSNGKDYWLLTHQWATNAFLVYPITTAGIGAPDTIRIGSVLEDRFGFLKASPDGRKLACSSRGTTLRPFDLYNFDPSTGQITNHVNLGLLKTAYGVSFSPDNTKLYVSNMTTAGTSGPTIYHELIRQYNLQAESVEAIIASGKSIIYQNPFTNINQQQGKFSDFYAPSLQLGPDGRLYCSSNGNALLCPECGYRFFVIDKPNELGFACEVSVKDVQFPTGWVGNASDFPNFMQQYFNGLESQAYSPDANDGCTESEIILAPNPAFDYVDLFVQSWCVTKYNLRIINVSGQVLTSYMVSEPRLHRVKTSHLSAGIYLAEIRLKNRTIVKKFFKY
jgi:hypothetical protein